MGDIVHGMNLGTQMTFRAGVLFVCLFHLCAHEFHLVLLSAALPPDYLLCTARVVLWATSCLPILYQLHAHPSQLHRPPECQHTPKSRSLQPDSHLLSNKIEVNEFSWKVFLTSSSDQSMKSTLGKTLPLYNVSHTGIRHLVDIKWSAKQPRLRFSNSLPTRSYFWSRGEHQTACMLQLHYPTETGLNSHVHTPWANKCTQFTLWKHRDLPPGNSYISFFSEKLTLF